MQPSFLHRLFWGIVLVAVGAVFLLNQTGVIDFDVGDLFSTYWPVFIILFGLQGLLLQRSGGFLWSLIVIAVGAVLLGRNLGWGWELQDLFSLIGPVILIVFGLRMITRGAKPKRDRQDEEGKGYGWNPVTPPPVPPASPPGPSGLDIPEGPPPAPPLTDDPNASFTGYEADRASRPAEDNRAAAPQFHDRRDRFKERQARWEKKCQNRQHRRDWWSYDPNASQQHRFIGDVHIGEEYWELRPMNISHFIGDTKLDLTKAQIPLGETKIYVSCFIGDVKVFVPNDFSVGVQVVSSSLIGDVRVWDQKRGGLFNHVSVESPAYSDADKKVVLIVSAFIGDVQVTKVG